MPEPLRPAPAKLYGRENYIWIPTIASATLAPTVAEATGASALDLTNILFEDGVPEPTAETNRVEQVRRAGDTVNYGFLGATKYSGGEMIMSLAPQAAALADGVKAWEKFATEGQQGFIAKREDIPKATAVASGQKLTWVVPVELGPRTPTKSGDGEARQGAFKIPFEVISVPAFLVAVLT